MTEISKQYAEALFMLAAEEAEEQEISEALHVISQIFAENPEYIDFLSTPSIPKSERIYAIEAAFSGKAPQNAVNFLELLCERGHIRCFFECAEEFDNIYNASRRIKSAKVTSAVSLTDDEKASLRAKLEALYKCTVDICYSEDRTLIGGLVIEIDGHTIDGSLKQRLHEIKEVIY